MSSDTHSTATLNNLRQWHRSCSKSSTRSSSASSQSSTDPTRPVTHLGSACTRIHSQPSHRPTAPPRTPSVEDYWNQKPPRELEIHSTPPSSRSSLEETQSQTDDYHCIIEHYHSRPRTQTVTPATVRRALQRDSDRMRIPFPGSSQRDSASSIDSPPSLCSSDSASMCDEELGGIPARHPLRNRVNSKGSSLLFSDADGRPTSPTKSLRVRAPYRPESTSSHSSSYSSSPPRTSSLRVKPKKTHSHRGAMTLFKSLASSPNPEYPQKLPDVEFDWAEQRRQDLERRAKLLEREIKDARKAMETKSKAEREDQTPADNDTAAKDIVSLRPRSWELTPEEVALRHEQQEEEGKRFVFKDHVWVNRSYVSAHPKDTVPYPLAYDNVNVQTDRHSQDLVKQLFSGRPSIHGDLSQMPPAFVLDLGCGDGAWLVEAAQYWKSTRFYGLDLQKLHPSRAQLLADLGEVADNIRFMYYNFLVDKLPYLDEKFDMVRMANLKWAIPEDKWDFLLQEAHRVLRRGGWVEIIDDDFLLGISPNNTLSIEQRITSDTLETQFMDMLQSRNLLLNTSGHFMSEKLGRWFNAFHEDDFPISISKARPVSVELHGQGPTQIMIPSEGMSQKAAKLMGFGLDSAHEKHRSAGSTKSRSRSGSVSSGVSYSSGVSCSSGRDAERLDDRVDDEQPGTPDEANKRPTSQPLGLDVHPGRFMPFPPAELNAHAVRNMQSILAAKEAIRAHNLKKSPELEALEVKEDLLPEERQRFDELSWEWNEQQNAFDDAFWDFETAMLKRLDLPQRCFDMDDDDDHHKSFGTHSRPQPLRTASGLSKLHKNGDGSLPSPVASMSSVRSHSTVRLIRAYSGWK